MQTTSGLRLTLNQLFKELPRKVQDQSCKLSCPTGSENGTCPCDSPTECLMPRWLDADIYHNEISVPSYIEPRAEDAETLLERWNEIKKEWKESPQEIPSYN